MDSTSIQAFTRNGPSRRWGITRDRDVALTRTCLYFVGRKRIVGLICRDRILVRIVLLESSPSIQGIKLPFPERRLEFLCDCIGKELP